MWRNERLKILEYCFEKRERKYTKADEGFRDWTKY